jgi:hypothetical protein
MTISSALSTSVREFFGIFWQASRLLAEGGLRPPPVVRVELVDGIVEAVERGFPRPS